MKIEADCWLHVIANKQIMMLQKIIFQGQKFYKFDQSNKLFIPPYLCEQIDEYKGANFPGRVFSLVPRLQL